MKAFLEVHCIVEDTTIDTEKNTTLDIIHEGEIMKITKGQLKRIIVESLGLRLNEARIINFRKVRKDLFDLKKDISNQDLLDKVQAHADELKAKVDQGEGKLGKGRYREAVTLLQSLEDILKAPTPEKIDNVTTDLDDVEEPDPTTPDPADPDPDDPDPWVPDPDPKVEWEYKVVNCEWIARKKGTEKEYNLGPTNGSGSGGKYSKSIAKLNKAYPDLVKGCDVKVPPKPTPPSKKGSQWPENAINLIETTKIKSDVPNTVKAWKRAFASACRSYESDNGLAMQQFMKGMNPGQVFATHFEWLADGLVDPNGKATAEFLIDEVNDMSKAAKLSGLNNHDQNSNPLSGDKINESLSRGSFYRRRYRRY